MKLNEEEARELLRRYRIGHASKREFKIIERWYHSYDQNVEKKVNLLDAGRLDELAREMLGNIAGKIRQAERHQQMNGEGKPVQRKNFFHFANLIRMAAVLLIGAGLGGLFCEHHHSVVEQEERGAADNITPREPSTIYLSDGSVVWLKGESKLEYPKTFAGGVREVSLIGEAFFDVAKDGARPFIIHSAHFTTRVLGTSFNIRAYENDESQEVEVVRGRVVVSVKESSSNALKQLILSCNQKAIYSRKDNSLVETVVGDGVIHNSLSKHRLVFNETSLNDIMRVLNTAHKVNISLTEERMKHCIITADLRNESLETSIAILSKAINAEYSIDGKNIVLRGDGCGNGN